MRRHIITVLSGFLCIIVSGWRIVWSAINRVVLMLQMLTVAKWGTTKLEHTVLILMLAKPIIYRKENVVRVGVVMALNTLHVKANLRNNPIRPTLIGLKNLRYPVLMRTVFHGAINRKNNAESVRRTRFVGEWAIIK
jgi:hypothetical protein